MTLDKLLDQETCPHNVIRYDGVYEGLGDMEDRIVRMASWTCYHPRMPHCGATMSGRHHEKGRQLIGYDKQFYPSQKRGLYKRNE